MIKITIMLLFLPFSDFQKEYVSETGNSVSVSCKTDSDKDIQIMPYYNEPDGSEFPVKGSFTESQEGIIPLGN